MSRRSRSFKSPQITSGFKQLARVRNTREELERLIIACEGKVSEKNYFQDFFNDLKQNRRIANTSFVIVRHQHTDPLGVLEDLLSHLEQDSNFEHKWIVIDRDKERTNGGGHSERSFNEAIRKAKRKNINVAYSNPCFEIWYLLHLEFRNTAIDRDDIIKELEKN